MTTTAIERIELDELPVAVLVFASAEGLIDANAEWSRLTSQSLAKSADGGWLEAIHGEDRREAAAQVESALVGESDQVDEWRLVGTDSQPVTWVQARSRHIAAGDRARCVITLTEIDRQKRNEARLVHLSEHDPLTGLLNRDALLSRIDDAIASPDPDRLTAVLFLDFDDFKNVNDRFGHHSGDLVLIAAGRRLRSVLRPTDVAGRLGGDEIGVLCPAVASPTEAIAVARRVVDAVGSRFSIGNEAVRISASIGVAFAMPGDSSLSVVDHADRAMYQAKAAGRSRSVLLDASGEATVLHSASAQVGWSE